MPKLISSTQFTAPFLRERFSKYSFDSAVTPPKTAASVGGVIRRSLLLRKIDILAPATYAAARDSPLSHSYVALVEMSFKGFASNAIHAVKLFVELDRLILEPLLPAASAMCPV